MVKEGMRVMGTEGAPLVLAPVFADALPSDDVRHSLSSAELEAKTEELVGPLNPKIARRALLCRPSHWT